ncbi:MAG: hypothetical protein ACOYXM_03090 [Actinomycetota bacterium]
MEVQTAVSGPALAAPPPGSDGAEVERGTRAAALTWVLLVALALWWGSRSIAGHGIGIDAAPLVGRWTWHATWGLLAPVVVAGLVVAVGPRAAATLRWARVPLAAGSAASVWALSLAASDGWARVTAPLLTRHEYEPFAESITSPGGFLEHFIERLPSTPIHVQGHPPGAPLVPWLLDRLALGGAGWFAAVVILGWGLAVASALVAARHVAGEAAARRAAPALVLLPAAVWAGTSADALFAGVLGVAIALALVGRRALAAGAAFGVALMLTYGAVAVAVIPAVVLASQRRWSSLALLAGGGLAVLLAVDLATGFSWMDGLRATHRAYYAGIAADRPAPYFALVGNPAALALAAGPAVAVGLAAVIRRWRDASSVLPLAAFGAVALANLSLLSKGEVERIWLPFIPWLALAAPGNRRGWLAAQAALAVALQAGLRSKW